MIDVANLIAKVRIPDRDWMWMGQGWATDGHFAILVGERGTAVDHEDPDRQAKREAGITGILAAERRPLKERAGWRKPFVPGPGKIRCRTCRGRGEHRCECDDSHECGDCSGTGDDFDYRPKSQGQIVFDGPDGLTINLAGRFAPLIDTAALLFTCRDSDQSNQALAPVLCVDGEGKPFAVVMPMRDEPEEPTREAA